MNTELELLHELRNRYFMSKFKASSTKSCGECSACCFTLKIDEDTLKKPHDTWCTHCESGCSIYESRPPVCRSWYCTYMFFDELTSRTRPDKSGIISYPFYGLLHKYEQPCIILNHVDIARDALPPGSEVLRRYGRLGKKYKLFIMYKFSGQTMCMIDENGYPIPEDKWPEQNPFDWPEKLYIAQS